MEIWIYPPASKDWIWDNADNDDDNDWYLDDNDAFVCNLKEWEDTDNDWVWNNEDQFDNNKAPKAVIVLSDSDIQVNSEVTFDWSSSSDEDWEIVSFTWLIDWNQISNSPLLIHSFIEPWGYKVSLDVKDDIWEISSKSVTVFVSSSIFDGYLRILFWLILILFLWIFITYLRSTKIFHNKKID